MAILVPSTNKQQKRIPTASFKQRIRRTEKFLSSLYGGYTEVDAKGGYTADDGNTLIEEPIAKVTAFTTDVVFKAKSNELKRFLKTAGSEWGQEAIGYEYEGDLYYV